MSPRVKQLAILTLLCSFFVCGGIFSQTFASDSSGISGPEVSKEETATGSCRKLEAEHRKILAELRGLKREIASLKQSISKPGSREIFGGIGYILGLTGVAFFWSARKKR